MSQAEQVDALFGTAARLGQVTGLVNNAGSTLHTADLADTPVDIVRRVVEVNLIGAILVARRAVQDMVDGGAIVNVSSAAATLGSPVIKVAAFSYGIRQAVAARAENRRGRR